MARSASSRVWTSRSTGASALVILGRSGSRQERDPETAHRSREARRRHASLFDGLEITDLSERALYPMRRRVAMLFQGGALFDSMTVFQNVSFPLREHDRSGRRRRSPSVVRREAVWLVRQPAWRSRAPLPLGTLRGHEEARGAGAIPGAWIPEVVLFDEPHDRTRSGHLRYHRPPDAEPRNEELGDDLGGRHPRSSRMARAGGRPRGLPRRGALHVSWAPGTRRSRADGDTALTRLPRRPARGGRECGVRPGLACWSILAIIASLGLMAIFLVGARNKSSSEPQERVLRELRVGRAAWRPEGRCSSTASPWAAFGGSSCRSEVDEKLLTVWISV